MRRVRRPPTAVVVITLAVLAVTIGVLRRDDPRPALSPGTAVVARIVDGDTVMLDLGAGTETVRLIGIDTPETKHPTKPVMCFGAEASAHLNELIPPGTVVRAERDVEARDRYDRLLLYLHRADDDLFVNLAMAADGYAAVATFAPNVAHTDAFVAAVAEARSAGLGLWAACGGIDTPAT
ncbi:hypothetical protein BH20ACT2_BH20ACT2_13430 [soil metagenome]